MTIDELTKIKARLKTSYAYTEAFKVKVPCEVDTHLLDELIEVYERYTAQLMKAEITKTKEEEEAMDVLFW